MLIIVGAIIVIGGVLGGFSMAGGHIHSLLHLSEFVTILGAALGALIIMAPMRVIKAMIGQIVGALKGSPFSKSGYEDMFKALYELFMIGRRNGMIALEEHVVSPDKSSIFTKYPSFLKNHHAVEFLCSSLRPIIDGKMKPEQLKVLLDIELEAMEEEHHQPIGVLQKVGDAMPGFGIVAAVLGIVVTMGAINGPIEEIGHKVGAALVGTFLGILVSYGFINPMTVNMEFVGGAEMLYFKSMASAVVGFATGMAPVMAVEVARRGLTSDIKPSAEELEEMLKNIGKK
jgi:chemotaxis protein MotA